MKKRFKKKEEKKKKQAEKLLDRKVSPHEEKDLNIFSCKLCHLERFGFSSAVAYQAVR